MRTASVSLVCLAIAALGCVELRYPEPSADRPATMDVRDASDAPDVPDVPVAPDVPDVPVATDVPVTPDVPVTIDVPDVRDVVDVVDARDVPEVFDAGTDVPRDVPLDIPTDFGPTSITLVNATASYSQSSFEVGRAVDGNTGGGQGWGIAPPDAGAVGEQSAVFEFATTTPVSSNGTRLIVSLFNSSSFFRLASFRLALTTAGRATFADGLGTGGNLGPAAAWTTPITVAAFSASNSVTITSSGTSFLTSLNNSLSVYTITLDTPASQLTGLRIDAVFNAAIPGGGPGSATGLNPGNFILSEVQVSVSSRP